MGKRNDDQKKRIALGVIAGLVVAAVVAGIAWGLWWIKQPKFRDVTISAGEGDSLQVEAFLTEWALSEWAAFVTAPGSIDDNVAGEYPVTLRHGWREETVTLRIQDTQAPVLKVQDLTAYIDQLPAPEDFVTEVQDQSRVSLSFGEPIVVPEDYSDITVTVVATDAGGNVSEATCTLSFLWMRETVTVEYGAKVSTKDILCDPEKDSAMIAADDLNLINKGPAGTYMVSTTAGEKTLQCAVVIRDTTGPTLKLKVHKVHPGSSFKLNDFVESATDRSGKVKLTLMSAPESTAEMGEYTVEIVAVDIYGNKTTGQTILRVAQDIKSPLIYGASQILKVAKHSTPDYMAGVSAYDNIDGRIEVTLDAGMVDTSKGGTYYITYTAVDSTGNETVIRREVLVEHDEEDTKAMVKEIAAKLPSDPELIRDYVRNTIKYSHDWGGTDPVWRGFTENHGNCYVHALCLQVLLTEKGYNTQLIWTTQKTHYWLIIELEPGLWRHIDATPGNVHTRISIMTDKERLSTLSGRYWRFAEWPACE